MKSKKTIPNYRDYLNLDSLLKSQKLISEKRGEKAHDEMLFIVSHQVYELWFKQILYEIDSVFEIFDMELVDESQIGTAVSRLHRINEIIQLLIDQIKILETMTPMDFLEFRDLLTPASGFQSGQFRLIENKIGLRKNDRHTYGGKDYKNKILTETNLIVSIEASETNYWKKYTGSNGLNFGIDDFGKSAPYKEIYNHFNLNTESIVKKIKEKL